MLAPVGSSAGRFVASKQKPANALLALLGALCLLAPLCLLAAASGGAADSAQHADLQQPAKDAIEEFAAAASQNYEQLQQQHAHLQQPAKAKKIQIVYIKVPLAKLRPTLGQQPQHGADSYGAAGNSSNGGGYTKADQQQHEPTASTSATKSTAFGSQQQNNVAAQQADGGEQLANELGGRVAVAGDAQQQSFIIPMALVQTASSDEPSPAAAGRGGAESAATQQPLGSAGSQLHASHALPGQPEPTNARRSPMQTYQQRLQQQMAASAAASASATSNGLYSPSGLAHGFMSSFLLGEKEKMNAAAMRLAQIGAQTGDQLRFAPQQLNAAATTTSTATTSALTVQPNDNNNNNPNSNHPNDLPHKLVGQFGGGGLMSAMMLPFSRLPDYAIGQAYGAAVGQALPLESGSPTSLLGSSSSASNYAAPTQQQQHKAERHLAANSSNTGGAAGTNWDASSSSGTGSSQSYGASSQNQQHAISQGNAYQQQQPNFAGTGPSSGYGSGTNTFGASAAFSDFPAGSAQAANSHFSHQQPQRPAAGEAANQPDGYQNGQRLKQAKKTIIPIVVQVEHAILEANAQQQQQRANKYGGAGRGHRQLGGSKRFRHQQQRDQQYRGQNQVYGAATNEVAHFGDIPPGASFVNAANAHDINKITAQINAENAASAAAALAQADAAFGPGAPAYTPTQQHMGGGGGGGAHMRRPMGYGANGGGQSAAYAAGLQSAASALLANSHPIIQAAASNGIASVSKLGAKLGEMIALPSMQVPNPMSSFPSALSSLTNQMGVQLGQAVQQVAKEHPTAHAFARQVAQQAGIQLPNFAGSGPIQSMGGGSGQHMASGGQQQVGGSQLVGAASSQQPQLAAIGQLSPQALQNLKLSIGQNLQSAAAQLMSGAQKGGGGLLGQSSLLGDSNQNTLNLALKQLGAISPAAAQLAGQLASSMQPQQSQQSSSPLQAAASSLVENLSAAPQQQQQQSVGIGQLQQQLGQLMQQTVSGDSSLGAATQDSQAAGASPTKSAKSLKSKFFSFFQPPKFISNMFSWNDRQAAERKDEGELNDPHAVQFEAPPASSGAAATKKKLDASAPTNSTAPTAATSSASTAHAATTTTLTTTTTAAKSAAAETARPTSAAPPTSASPQTTPGGASNSPSAATTAAAAATTTTTTTTARN